MFPWGAHFLVLGSIPELGTALGGGVPGSRCGTMGSLWGLGVPDLLLSILLQSRSKFPFRSRLYDCWSRPPLWLALQGGRASLGAVPLLSALLLATSAGLHLQTQSQGEAF